MWPFKSKKEKYVPLELLEKRLKEKNILNDDERLYISIESIFNDDRSNAYTVNIFRENTE